MVPPKWLYGSDGPVDRVSGLPSANKKPAVSPLHEVEINSLQGSKSTRAAQSMSLGDAGAKLLARFDFEAASVGLVRSDGAGAGVLTMLS